jgi:hypothetical protein
MKPYIPLIIAGAFLSSSIQAQTPEEALKYSFLQQGGTARNLATGGAMASLGGEFSTLFINPAGLGLFNTNEAVLSPKLSNIKNNFNYRNNSLLRTNSNYGFDLGASGFIWALPHSSENRDEGHVAFGLGLNQVADFNNRYSYNGLNNQSSFSEKYLEELINTNSTNPNKAAYDFPYGSSLAINTYLVDPVFVNGQVVGYKSAAQAALANGLQQSNTVETKGGAYDVSFGFGMTGNRKLFIGASGSLLITNYEKRQTYSEREFTPVANNKFNSFSVEEVLKTNGIGGNFKIGAIYRPTERVRLGLAVHTPSFYSLTDKQEAYFTTDTENYQGVQRQNSKDVINYQRNTLGINVNERAKYNFNTPWRVMASASYVFRETDNVKKQRAFITGDVEYLNYRNITFGERTGEDENGNALPGDPNYANYLKGIKTASKKMYRGAFNARLGAELKLNIFMLRGGVAYYGNPYKDKANLKTHRMNYSAGVGYRHKGIFIDATYIYGTGRDIDRPYILSDKPNTFASNKLNTNNFALTVGTKF